MQKPYYKKPKFTLYQADCLELLESLPENSVDMVLPILHTTFQMEDLQSMLGDV